MENKKPMGNSISPLSNGLEKDYEYLKKYVQQHPENQMAWYLLGKEYATKGEKRKAKYCFAKSGGIYEAFEQKHLSYAVNKKWWRFFSYKNILSFLFLLLLVLFVPFGQNKKTLDPLPVEEISHPITEVKSVAPQKNPESLQAQIYYSTEVNSKDAIQSFLKKLEKSTAPLSTYDVLLNGIHTKDKKWVIWPKDPLILLSVDDTKIDGQVSIHYHDAASCGCTPSDATKAKSIATTWKQQQEQQMVLYSAILAYKDINGQLPNSIHNLTQDYPKNVLSGESPMMNQAFSQLVMKEEEQESKKKESIQAKNLASSNITNASNVQPIKEQPTKKQTEKNTFPFSAALQPLQIIIDKDKHRLAIVSGNIILRSYPVGLGGKKTPEGSFFISEKVKNPNGKSDGDFGSRGMVLSNTNYAIHGTNQPKSIGKDQSHGCIRMNKDDVEELYSLTPLHTKVTIGSHSLPEEIIRGKQRFHVTSTSNEINRKKIYHWLY